MSAIMAKNMGQVDPNKTILEMYQELQGWCQDRFGVEPCNAFLPENPIFLPPPEEKRILKNPLVWFLGGMLAYRVLFR